MYANQGQDVDYAVTKSLLIEKVSSELTKITSEIAKQDIYKYDV